MPILTEEQEEINNENFTISGYLDILTTVDVGWTEEKKE
jgi:hypothetical protein